MNIVLLSRDLMLLARAEGAARKVGLTLTNVSDAAQALQLAGDESCGGVVIDLRLPALDIGNLVAQLRDTRGGKFSMIACGPHVHEVNLAAAREVGCDVVATRGQFERDAEEILRHCFAADKS